MADYYLDMETSGLDPNLSKIITIQYQKLDRLTGKPLGDLCILKEWESSEEDIFKRFMQVFNLSKKWEFIPVGTNLLFEFSFILAKAKKYLNLNIDPMYFCHTKPYLDIKPVLILMNQGVFSGAGLDKLTSKEHSGSVIPNWYANKAYDKIITYVKKETEAFVCFYQKIKQILGSRSLIQDTSSNQH